MRRAIKDFTQDYSDGGKDITEKEIHQWYERIHSMYNKVYVLQIPLMLTRRGSGSAF